jgi:hypothetical protein
MEIGKSFFGKTIRIELRWDIRTTTRDGFKDGNLF